MRKSLEKVKSLAMMDRDTAFGENTDEELGLLKDKGAADA